MCFVVTFEVFTTVTMKNAVFWDMAVVRTDVSEESIASIVLRLLVTAEVPSSSILVTRIIEELLYPETSVLTRTTRRNIPEYGILHSYRREKPQIFHSINGLGSVAWT
jgi:hypothetical protein